MNKQFYYDKVKAYLDKGCILHEFLDCHKYHGFAIVSYKEQGPAGHSWERDIMVTAEGELITPFGDNVKDLD